MTGKLFGNTLTVTIFNGLGIALALAINILIAAKFGIGFEMDTYIAAITLPTFFITIFAGSLSITFIPVFSEYKYKSFKEAWEIVSVFINFCCLCLFVLIVIFIFSSGFLMKIVTPGFSAEQLEYASYIFRFYSVFLFFSILNELFASIYYAHGKFLEPMLNKVIGPVVTIIIVILLGDKARVMSIVYATIIGGVIQFTILLYGLFVNKTFSYKPSFKIYDKRINEILRLMIPLIAGMTIYKIVPVFDKFILSGLPVGSISYINYSSKIFVSITQIISASISLTVFPKLAEIAARKDFDSLQNFISEIIRILFFIISPIMMALFFFSHPVVRFLFERGAFTSKDSLIVSDSLQLYLLSWPVVSIGSIVSQGFYVLKDTRTPAIVGVLEVGLYIGLAFLLIRFFGVLAIPITYSIYFTFSVLLLSFLFVKKIQIGRGLRIVKSFLKFNMVSIIVILPFYLVFKAWLKEYDLMGLLFIAVCILLYYLVSIYYNIYEAQVLYKTVTAFLYKNKKPSDKSATFE